MTTLNVHMKWIDSPAMKEAMAASDFSFAELKHTKSTVFLVIPPDYFESHTRYLRLFWFADSGAL
jgi:type IV secretion system protein VirD4